MVDELLLSPRRHALFWPKNKGADTLCSAGLMVSARYLMCVYFGIEGAGGVEPLRMRGVLEKILPILSFGSGYRKTEYHPINRIQSN